MHPEFSVLDYRTTIGDRTFWSSSLFMQSDLDSNSITESNIRYLLKELEDSLVHCSFSDLRGDYFGDIDPKLERAEMIVAHGDFNSIEVLFSEKVVEENDILAKILTNLCGYCVISDELLSQIEFEWFVNYIEDLDPQTLFEEEMERIQEKLKLESNRRILAEKDLLMKCYYETQSNPNSLEKLQSALYAFGFDCGWEIESSRGLSSWTRYDENALISFLCNYFISGYKMETGTELISLRNYIMENRHE